MLPVLVFQLEVYYMAYRLLTGLTAQQKGTTIRWYSNKTSLGKVNKAKKRIWMRNLSSTCKFLRTDCGACLLSQKG